LAVITLNESQKIEEAIAAYEAIEAEEQTRYGQSAYLHGLEHSNNVNDENAVYVSEQMDAALDHYIATLAVMDEYNTAMQNAPDPNLDQAA
jgi:hypothetical protein